MFQNYPSVEDLSNDLKSALETLIENSIMPEFYSSVEEIAGVENRHMFDSCLNKTVGSELILTSPLSGHSPSKQMLGWIINKPEAMNVILGCAINIPHALRPFVSSEGNLLYISYRCVGSERLVKISNRLNDLEVLNINGNTIIRYAINLDTHSAVDIVKMIPTILSNYKHLLTRFPECSPLMNSLPVFQA